MSDSLHSRVCAPRVIGTPALSGVKRERSKIPRLSRARSRRTSVIPAAPSVGLLGYADGHADRIGQGEARGLQRRTASIALAMPAADDLSGIISDARRCAISSTPRVIPRARARITAATARGVSSRAAAVRSARRRTTRAVEQATPIRRSSIALRREANTARDPVTGRLAAASCRRRASACRHSAHCFRCASRRAYSVRRIWAPTKVESPSRASSQFMAVAGGGSSTATRTLIIATADRPAKGRPRERSTAW